MMTWVVAGILFAIAAAGFLLRNRKLRARFGERGVPSFDPTDADHHNALGMKRMDQPAHAITHFKAALQLKPDDPLFLANLGIAQRRAGQLDDAQQTLERALILAPNDGKTYHSLANVFAERGQYRDAVNTYLKALAREPLLGMAAAGLIETLHLMISDRATEPEDADQLVSLQREFEEAGQKLTAEFTEAVRAGYGRGTDEKIGKLLPQWLVERMMETAGLLETDASTKQLGNLMRLASEATTLSFWQEQMQLPPENG